MPTSSQYQRSSPYLSPTYNQDLDAASNGDYAYNTPLNPIRFDPTSDPREAFQNERARATWLGDANEDEFRGATAPELEEYRRSRRMADAAYQPIARGEGGYSVPEATDILDRQRLESLQLTPEEYNQAWLTPDEQQAVIGNPRSAFAYFNPQHIEGVADTGAAYERDVINDTRNNVRNSYNDPSLNMDPNFGNVQTQALSSLEGGVNRAYDPRTLSLDQNFVSKYPMSDAEVQAQGDLGARIASSRYGALEDEIVRRGSAANSPALAIGAMRGRMERDAGINAADAGTSARLAALQAQRDQLRQLEAMRLGAEQYKTNTGTDIAFGLGDRRLSTNQNIEDTRLGAAQNRANLAAGSELNLGGLRAGTEAGISGRNLGVAQYNTDTGVGLEQYGESQSANRNLARAQNRQGVAADLRNERYDRGIGVSDRVSGRTTGVADARRADEQGYRDYLERRGAVAGDFYQQGANRRIQGQQVTGNQSLGATEGMANHDIGRRNAKSWWQRNLSPIVSDATDAFAASQGRRR